MAKYLGRVKRSDLEGGGWIFITDAGVTYQLKGGGPELLRDGQRAEVEGQIADDTVGIMMVGEVLEVKRYRVLP